MTSPLPSASPRRKITALGPGTLVLGNVGTQLDMSCQLTEIKISAEGESEDPVNVLCGDVIAGSRSYTYTLSGTLFQDFQKDGVIDWTWKYAGTEVPFKFVPDATGAAAVTGRTIVDPIEIGGEVKKKNTSEIEWACVGTPTFTPMAATTTTGT